MAFSVPRREIRMLTALLAACDPCGYVDMGGPPGLYTGLAVALAGRLHRNAEPADLLQAFPGEAEAAAAFQFAVVAIDWFHNGRHREIPGAAETAAA